MVALKDDVKNPSREWSPDEVEVRRWWKIRCLFPYVRGARASMPGMMDTILNLGLNDEVVEGLARKTNNPRFAWDSYRRFVQMYGDVVLGMKPVNKEDIDPFEAIIEEVKKAKGRTSGQRTDVDDLKTLVVRFRWKPWRNRPDRNSRHVPTNSCGVPSVPYSIHGWTNAPSFTVRWKVFRQSGEQPSTYRPWYSVTWVRLRLRCMLLTRRRYRWRPVQRWIPDQCAGRRRCSRYPYSAADYQDRFSALGPTAGYLVKRNVWPNIPSMEEAMPEIYKELDELQTKLENHYHDMRDMEFTVQEGKLWFLQTRNGKRTGAAMVRIAMEMLHQGMIDEKTALMRDANLISWTSCCIRYSIKEELGRPRADTWFASFSGCCLRTYRILRRRCCRMACQRTSRVVLVRIETSPEDLAGMAVAEGILTARGGMTSHAAVVCPRNG